MELSLRSFFKFRLAEKQRNTVCSFDSFFVARRYVNVTNELKFSVKLLLLYIVASTISQNSLVYFTLITTVNKEMRIDIFGLHRPKNGEKQLVCLS